MIDKKTLDGLRIERPDEKKSRKGLPWLVMALVAVVAVAMAAWGWVRGSEKEVHVATAHPIAGASRGAVLNASGYVTARREATVSSKVTGKIVEVNVEEGMRVKEGQVLARLDAATPTRALELARAEAKAAASALEETRVRIHQAQLAFDRAVQLTKGDIASQSDLDNARAELDANRARLVAQTDQLASAQRQVDLQRQNVEDTIIRAPFDGIVVTKDAQPGEMISPVSAGGGFTRTGICTVVDMDSLEIEVDVNEAYIHRVHADQKVDAVLDAYPDWHIPAHVIIPVPTADRQKATVKVRIALDQTDPRILPDMGVKVTFITDEPSSAASTVIEVPRSAVRRDGEQDIVFVVKDDKAERRAVKVIAAEGDKARLGSGVSGGEQVVTEAPTDLEDGDKVKIVK